MRMIIERTLSDLSRSGEIDMIIETNELLWFLDFIKNISNILINMSPGMRILNQFRSSAVLLSFIRHLKNIQIIQVIYKHINISKKFILLNLIYYFLKGF